MGVPDLETAPGFDTFLASLDEERRRRLLGWDLPLIPDIDERDLPTMIDGSARHFMRAFSQAIFRLYKVERAMDATAPMLVLANSRIFEFQAAVTRRVPGLSKVLSRIESTESEVGFWLGGCFFMATSTDPRLQAFAPGVFRLLLENQNHVAWTNETLADEADYQRWIIVGYAAMAIFLISLGALGYWRWRDYGG